MGDKLEFQCEKCDKKFDDKDDIIRLDLVGLEVIKNKKRSGEIPYHAEAFYLCKECFNDTFDDLRLDWEWFMKNKPDNL